MAVSANPDQMPPKYNKDFWYLNENNRRESHMISEPNVNAMTTETRIPDMIPIAFPALM